MKGNGRTTRDNTWLTCPRKFPYFQNEIVSLAFVELVIIVTFRRVDKEGKEEVMDPIEIDRNEGVALSALFDLELLV